MLDARHPVRLLATILCALNAGLCQADASHPCSFCEAWQNRTLNNLRKSVGDERETALDICFLHIEAFYYQQTSFYSSQSVPGSAKISSLVDSGDDFSNNNNVIISTIGSLYGDLEDLEVHESIGVTTNMAGEGLPPSSVAMPLSGGTLTPGTIQSPDMPMNYLPQATPSVAGSTEGLPV